jgi:hypothetical protein
METRKPNHRAGVIVLLLVILLAIGLWQCYGAWLLAQVPGHGL